MKRVQLTVEVTHLHFAMNGKIICELEIKYRDYNQKKVTRTLVIHISDEIFK